MGTFGSGLNMRPQFSMEDFRYSRPRDAEEARDNNSFNAALAHGQNLSSLRIGQFGKGKGFPSRAVLSALVPAINAVVHVGSQEQMARTAARRVIAFMAYVKPLGNRPNRYFISKPVCSLIPSITPNRPIAIVKSATRPFHASVAFWNRLKHFLEQSITANLVSHRCTLHWCASMALAALTRCGASSILSQGCA